LSALMTVPPNASAAASASADLRLAVGPPMRTMGVIAGMARGSSTAALAFPRRGTDNAAVTNVLTLIAAAPEPRLTIAAAAVAEALARLGAVLGRSETLAPDIARDIFFTELAADQAEAAARQALAAALGTHEIDLVAQGAAERRKRLLLADMESTIIENEMLDELADFLGLREEVAEITRRAMNDEIDFTAALEARVALLKGLDVSVLAKAAERIRIMPGAPELVATMRKHGACCALVSGGFLAFTGLVRQRLGFDR